MEGLFNRLISLELGAREKVFFALLIYLDLALTLFALHSGFSELNPFAQRLFANPRELFLLKGVGPLIITWLVPGKLLLPAIIFMLFVTAWNVKELLLFLV